MKQFTYTKRDIASNHTPRQINRNFIFNLIRTRQPISRADLARISGLQRSTVSLIVEELIAGRWVLEGPTGKLPRGRRPTFLQLNSQRAVIALDVHPSQTTVAVATLGGDIISQSLIPPPEKSSSALKNMVAGVRSMMLANKDRAFDGVGITLPGRADLHQEKLVFAPNLRAPIASIKSEVEKATGLRVEIDNVANACALAEVWFGESDGLHDLVVVNVDEGLGTGIFANGKLMRGESGMAGEFGHVQIDPEGAVCGCGNRGCWETTASNRAGLRFYHEIAPKSGVSTFEALVRLALNNDPSAIAALDKMTHNLGRGFRMIASSLDPREIIVVGDITSVWHKFAGNVEKELQRNSISKPPVIRPAYEGNTARLRSAVALVLNEGSV